jgi:hypothetical protein
MAFCTSCGAQVNGAFCTQCGAAITASGTAPAAAQAPAPAQPMPPAPAAKSGTSPIVWILVIVGGLFLLGAIAVIGAGYFFVHKARDFAANPGYAAAKLIMAANPNISEVSHDDNAGTITVRDNKSGQVMTWNFDDIKNGKFKITATDEKGQTATVELGSSTGKIPAWVPSYPGTDPKATFSVSASGAEGAGGNFTYTTNDPASKVMDFYQDKTKELGMQANVNVQGGQGQVLVATDDAHKRSLTIVIGESGGKTTVNLTYSEKP